MDHAFRYYPPGEKYEAQTGIVQWNFSTITVSAFTDEGRVVGAGVSKLKLLTRGQVAAV